MIPDNLTLQDNFDYQKFLDEHEGVSISLPECQALTNLDVMDIQFFNMGGQVLYRINYEYVTEISNALLEQIKILLSNKYFLI